MSTRKRRRDQAFSDEEPEAQLVVEEDANEKQKEKEQEVWDAIREAHYEGQIETTVKLSRHKLIVCLCCSYRTTSVDIGTPALTYEKIR